MKRNKTVKLKFKNKNKQTNKKSNRKKKEKMSLLLNYVGNFNDRSLAAQRLPFVKYEQPEFIYRVNQLI